MLSGSFVLQTSKLRGLHRIAIGVPFAKLDRPDRSPTLKSLSRHEVMHDQTADTVDPIIRAAGH